MLYLYRNQLICKFALVVNEKKTNNLPPGDLGRSQELTTEDGPTPVDHTNNPYGTSVPSLRIIF